jgi:radical SAM superfamily enzyme YgiQ (UPF0313 family)
MRDLYAKRKGVLSREKGVKGRRGKKNIVLFYPNSYSIGISSLAFHRIWELCRRNSEIGVLRYFLENEGEKDIFPLDEELDTSDVAVYAFFLSYENDYYNVIHALKKLRLQCFAKERNELPLVIAGGVAVTNNPEPLAEIFDAIFIGEVEDNFEQFLEIILAEDSKKELLEKLEKLESVYLPDRVTIEYDKDGVIKEISGRKVKRGVYKHFSQNFSTSLCVTEVGEFGNTFLIELTRGCPGQCKFCISRTIYTPLRFASYDKVKEVIENNKDVKKFGLLGASVSYHPHIKDIMALIVDSGKEFSLSSLRADLVDDEFIQLLKRGGTKTITIAPEAGTERMRNLISKGIDIGDIERAVRLSLKYEIENLKMYFLIGLPFESEEDIEGIIKLAGLIKHIENKERKRFKKVSFSISTFVPKPFTSLQWASFADVNQTNEKLKYIRKKLLSKGVTVLYDLPKWARLQAVLSRGDRRVVSLIMKGLENKYFSSVNINPAFYAERERSINEIFPWEVVECGLDRRVLLKHWEDYKKEASLSNY